MRRSALLALPAMLGLVMSSAPPAVGADGDAVAPIVGSWQIDALTADGFEFWIQYTFTSDGIVWVFVPDGRHGSGEWRETAPGEVTMSFVIQSGTEAVPSVERIWERFPMPAPGATTWSAGFSYFTEDIDGHVLEGGPSGSVVARRFDLREDLDGVTVVPSPSAAPSTEPTPPGTPAPQVSPSTDLSIATDAASPGTFDRDLLVASGGTQVTVTYDNRSNQLHDIAFYSGDSTDSRLIARTEPAAGPGTEVVTFTTPTAAGRYLFVCQLHPISMKGYLQVE